MSIIIRKKHTIVSVALLLLIVLNIVCLPSCSGYKYKEDWILGKTSSEIEEKYGEFYLTPTDSEYIKDGNYVSCACAYKIREKRVGFMGTDPEMFYRIYFDADGKACEVDDEWYVPGG